MSTRPVRLEPGPGSGRGLRDLLFERGVEFPCGGVTLCGGCKVRVLSGNVPVTPEMRVALTDEELSAGWRLGCMAEASGPVTLEIEQWSVEVLDDDAAVPFEPADGIAAVADIGTTTLVAQLVDRASGEVLAVETALNPQARFGADLMSRIYHEMAGPGALTALIREALGTMLARLAAGRALEEVLLVGNTAMHHLFCGLDVSPLAAVPFRSPHHGSQRLEAAALGWETNVRNGVCFVSCVGGFVGSDLLAGLVATGLHAAHGPGALLDLGTNGEIAVGDRTGIRCVSTAAGPAFEGGRIGMGVRAGAGAVDRVWVDGDRLAGSVIGGGAPRGLCGSGLVDAAAGALDLGWILPNGRLADGRKQFQVVDSVTLNQSDVRELQLAKGAIAAGFELLLGGERPASKSVHLAGAFGNYVNAASARRVGLLPAWVDDPTAAGNSALRGARALLLAGPHRQAILDQVLAIATHVELGANRDFQDAFVEAMAFPAPAS